MSTHPKNKQSITRPGDLSRADWPFTIEFTDVGGATIAYTDEGRGPILLLVHDGMWSFVWSQLIARLRDDFRVVTLDFPGAGWSPASDRPVGLEADSMILEGFVADLGLTDITLAVHDLGGPVGLGFATRQPELVNGLALINTFGWPPDSFGLRTMLRLVASGPVTAFDAITNSIPRLTSTHRGIGRHLDTAERRAFLAGFRARSARRRFHEMMASPLRETAYLEGVQQGLETVLHDVPALTIYGEKNDPFDLQAKFASRLSNVEEMVVPNGNHFPMCDDPDGVADRIRTWHAQMITN